MPLAAVMVMANDPAAAGVPASVAVPLPLSVKVTPLGRVAPVSDRVGSGKPVVVTVREPAVPALNVVLLALVMAGAAFTVSVKVWLASAPMPLSAVKCSV